MTNIRFLIYSIIFSATIHLSVIYFLNTENKDNEVYVVNLSEFRDFSIASPEVTKPKPVEQSPKKEIPKKAIPKKEVPKEILNKKDTLSLDKKIEKIDLVKPEKKEIIPKQPVKETNDLVKKQISTNAPKPSKAIKPSIPNQSLKKNVDVKIDKILSEYLSFVSLEINKMASKSYPIQSIKRREQGTITSILIIDKDGRLIDIEIKNKAPKRLYLSTIKILKKFNFPKPPDEILNSKGYLKIRIPVNYILK